MNKDLKRKSWPKIRVVWLKGDRFYQVDARRRGTAGKRETFAKQSEAEERAGTIAAEFVANVIQGLDMPADLRAMAFQGRAILEPFGKSILEACSFYRTYLTAEQEKETALR